MYQTILLAAGSSTRSNLNYNKVFYEIDGKPIILLSALNFLNDDRCEKIVLVSKENELEKLQAIFNQFNKVEYALGGNTRQESVNNGLKLIDSELVLIHDGARPYYSNDLLNEIVCNLKDKDAVIPSLKVLDTIKVIEDNKVVKTLNREVLRTIQTPQGFKTSVIKNAHDKAKRNDYTDDSSMVEELTKSDVYVVDGEVKNIKFTVKEDF